MAQNRFADLAALARNRPSVDTEPAVPRPRFNWTTRVLVPAAILGGFVVLFGATLYREMAPAVVVHAAPVVLKSVQGPIAGAVTVQAAGWIEADPYKSYVTALADGVVRELLVLEGEPVKAGQVVVRLVDDDARLAVERAEAKVREHDASLSAMRAELAAAKTDWENPVERKRAVDVSAAQLAEAQATLEQLAAEIAMDESKLEHARSDYERRVGLHGSGSISDSEMVRFRTEFHSQKAKLEATRMRHAALNELIAKHQADLRAAREHMELRTEERRKLDRAQAAVLQEEALLNQAKTALAEAKLRLERMSICSPIDGVVMARLTEPGSKVVIISDNPGSARVLSLYDPARLQVRVDVPLADAAKIGVGQQAHVIAEVLPDRTFNGTVTRVLHEANIQKNTLEVKVALSEPDPQLRPEMLARVRFLAKAESGSGKAGQRLFASEAAFRGGGTNPTAWVVRDFDGEHGIAAARSVKLGSIRANGWVDVLDGLQPGDLVITRSPGELAEGKRVKVVKE
ncbi:MAG: efflux RND transporter periplasmic adaptor subunit [Thermodesulfobacteriota bacterium]